MKILILILIFLNISVLSANENYDLTIKNYLNFNNGFEIKRQVTPTCPYDKCKNVLLKNAKIYYDKDKDLFYVKKPNYKKMVPILLKALKNNNNVYLSNQYVNFYIKNYNYKLYLKKDIDNENKKLKDYINLDPIKLQKTFITALQYLSTKNECLGDFYLSELNWKGYLGFKKNTSEAKVLMNKSTTECKKERRLYRKLIINLSRIKNN
jgi:hypothetical protein